MHGGPLIRELARESNRKRPRALANEWPEYLRKRPERASRSDRPRTTPNGNPKDQTRGHKADGEKVRHGRGHYYDLYSICDTTGCRVPGRLRCALRLQFLDLRLPHSYSIVTLLFGLIVHIQLFA